MEEVVGSIPTRSTNIPPCSSSPCHPVSSPRKLFRDNYFIAVKTTLPPTMVITT
jgi:hypothetical protein